MKTTIGAWTRAIGKGEADSSFSRLYGDDEIFFQRDRYGRLLQKMASLYDPGEVIVASAPGRTELGGNHTDHNGGRVLAAAVHLDTLAVAASGTGKTVNIHSDGFPEVIRVDLRDLTPGTGEKGTPAALVRGVAAGFVRDGFRIGGFNACVHSTLPIGTGLSSSASFEVLVGLIFNHLHNRGLVSDLSLARTARDAETVFFGKPCGFMDQMAVTFRGVLHMDFQDPDRPKTERLSGFFETLGHVLAIVDTGGSHAHLTEEYGAISREMGDVAACFSLPSARGLSRSGVVAAIPRLREETGDRAILRALHFIEENRRVEGQISALKKGWVKKFLRLVNESGNSSWKLLQNSMLPGEIRHQSLPLALALTEGFLRRDGACRIHGGGFAGTIQAYIPADRFGEYRRLMESVFGSRSVFPLRIRPAEAPAILTIDGRRTET